MSAVLKNQKHDQTYSRFLTIKENRNLRLLEPDDNKGIRNFRNTENLSGKNINTINVNIIRIIPWLVAGAIVTVSILT